MKYFLIVMTMVSLASCGRKTTHKSGTNTVTFSSSEETAEIVSAPGIYEMHFSPLNPVKFEAEGSLIQDVNEITISANGKKAFPFLPITQTIYEGDCPTAEDDRNNDGYIQFSEAEAHLGKLLLPLDAPRANLFGNYEYKTVTNKLQVQGKIQNRHGAIKVDWEKSVVLFQGTQASETLPVACAKMILK